MQTHVYEKVVIASALGAVAAVQGTPLLEASMWLAGSLCAQGLRSIADRQTEEYEVLGLTEALEKAKVDCWKWVSRYTLAATVIAAASGLMVSNWQGLAALALQLAYPHYREWYRAVGRAQKREVEAALVAWFQPRRWLALGLLWSFVYMCDWAQESGKEWEARAAL